MNCAPRVHLSIDLFVYAVTAMAAVLAAVRALTDRDRRRFAPYALHPSASFEGFYTKFALPSGAVLIVILCTVRAAPPGARAHNLVLTYIPADAADAPAWQRDLYPDAVRESASPLAFSVTASLAGRVIARLSATPALLEHTVDLPDGTAFSARTDTSAAAAAAPWYAGAASPEGPLLHALPLPLHWHVHTPAAPARFALSLPGSARLAPADREGAATAHAEKNWAAAFPAAHVWLCARAPGSGGGRGVCVAGGRTLGVDAALGGAAVTPLADGDAGGAAVEVSFRPPVSLAVPWLPRIGAPRLVISPDWLARSVSIAVRGPTTRIAIDASAPRGSFFALAAPGRGGFSDGGAMAETVRGRVGVRVWRRRGVRRAWAVVPVVGAGRGWQGEGAEVFEGAAVEFGGRFFPGVGADGEVG